MLIHNKSWNTAEVPEELKEANFLPVFEKAT